MFKRLAFLITLVSGIHARAFDPLTAGLGLDAADKLMEGVEEAADMGEAMTDLMQESEVDENLVREMEANVKRLEEVQAQYRSMKSTSRDVQDFLDFDLSRSKTLASKVRKVASKIRQGRRLVGMFSKKGQSTALQIEQVKLNYRILDEMRNMRLQAFNAYLEDKERKAKFASAMEKSLEEEKKFREEKFRNFKRRSK